MEVERTGRNLGFCSAIFLKRKIARRKKLLSTHKVNHLNMYCQVTGQVEPTLFLILDSFEGMKDEAFEGEMAKLLTKLSREGQAIGIHLVMTASRQSNLRATLYANFKHQLTLKQHDKTDARSAVGASQLEIEDVKGRGLIKLDDVYSFQIALPVRATDDISLLDLTRQEVARLASAWTGQRPEGVPMVPEELTVEDFYGRSSVQAAIAQGQIPLGLDLETVEAVSWKHQKGPLVYLVNDTQLMQTFAEHVAQVSQALDRYMVILSSPHHQLPSDLGGQVLSDTESVTEMLEALAVKIEERLKQDQSDHVATLIFYGATALIEQLPATAQSHLAFVLEKGHQAGYCSIVLTDTDITKKIDVASKAIRAAKEGLLGVRVADQNLFTILNKPLREGVLPSQIHYYVSDQQQASIKVLM